MIKHALVFGNSAYPGQYFLKSPKNDAQQVASALRRLKFDVTLGTDLERDSAYSLIDEFTSKISAARPAVTVVYYSGHGVQIEEMNFIVPIDFEDGDSVRLVNVQEIIDAVDRNTSVQIVLLDACRDKGAQKAIAAKGISLGKGKTLVVDERNAEATGLAAMRGPNGTFIAFATSPGDVAYDGDTFLSPFTEAFLKNVELVDLPISNLMSRVRKEVFIATEERQRPWDHSSLMAPFYFNPGSLFLFLGNALAILGLVLSCIPYSLYLSSPEASWQLFALSIIFPVLSLSILMYGTQTAYSRLRGAFQLDEEKSSTLLDHLFVSFQKGSLGGYLGSLITALGITFVYHQAWVERYNGPFAGNMSEPKSLGELCVQITTATVITGCILGFFALFFSRFSRGKLEPLESSSASRILLGTSLGGAFAGLICAPVLTYYFGQMPGPMLKPELLLPGGIAGSAIFVFSIVNFDFERLSSRRLAIGLLCALSAVVIGGVVAGALFGSLYSLGIVDRVINWMQDNDTNAAILLTGGAFYGVPVGIALGLVIGSAIALTNRWTGRNVLEAIR
ncbi:caspase family protein [Bradyrhizobium sp. AUGA SZCCT0222]|uniref:caspase family protein n=1 Tax=Bradyrhizobium sp. AUGA SZCCT0222 TaxID=2807668 RepID=UPI001BA5CF43|nr:caspase family protein [Bradyrhizobium sp. AUGA SZCCT0222]MBR1272538.1 caspase family protein [Bradyrhizobium sp. AUGA SZCCT0222]